MHNLFLWHDLINLLNEQGALGVFRKRLLSSLQIIKSSVFPEVFISQAELKPIPRVIAKIIAATGSPRNIPSRADFYDDVF